LAIVHLSASGVSGCGGGGDGMPSSDRTPTLRVANTGLGDVLVDSETDRRQRGEGRDDRDCRTLRRRAAVTYNGHPLYLFAGDNATGATNGQGMTAFGARWFVVSPAGNQVSGKSNAGRSNGY
jgi:Secreted repeat of unknown function